MGGSTSRSDFNQLRNRYQVVARDTDNNLTYLKDRRTQHRLMLKQLFANDEASVRHFEAELQRKKQLYHQHIAVLKDYDINLNEQFCSRMYWAGALYDLPQRTLEDERNDRTRNRTPFDQKELWSILASCILGLGYLQRNFVQHESVRSSNIYLEETGSIKIADPFAKQLPTNYEMYRQGRGTAGVYLSPAELRSFRQQHKYAVHNPYKSDVFSLAVVLLELAFLQEQGQLYQRNKGLLTEHLLRDKLDRIGRHYGEELKQVLAMMTNMNEGDRPGWDQLEGLVRGYEKIPDGKQKLSKDLHSFQQSSDRSSGSSIKPQTAEFTSSKLPISKQPKQDASPKRLQVSPNMHRHKREMAVINLQTPDHRTISGVSTPVSIGEAIPIKQHPIIQKAVRVSEPPLRSNQENSFYGAISQTPARPPTQHIPHVVQIFHQHQDPHFQPPFISGSNGASQLNITVNSQPGQQKSRTVNSFHSSNSDHHHQPGFHMPTERYIVHQMSSPMPKNPQPNLNSTFQIQGSSSAHRMKTEERPSHEFIVVNQHNTLREPAVHLVRKVPAEYPPPAEVRSFSPARAVQPFPVLIDSAARQKPTPEVERQLNSHSKGEQFKSTPKLIKQQEQAQQPVRKDPPQVLSLLPMEISIIDGPCSSEGLPLSSYNLKTGIDQNLANDSNSEDNSFLSESQSRQVRAGTVIGGRRQPIEAIALARIEENRKVRGSTPRPGIASHRSSQHDMRSEQKGSESRIPVSPPTVIIPPPTFYKKPEAEPPVSEGTKFVKEVYKQGSRYEGEKLKGMRHGKGRFYYDDGGMYDGNWSRNQMEGFGKLYYVSGQLAYQGIWSKDHFEGHGKLYNEKPRNINRFDYRSFDDIEDYWKTYEGEFKRDLKHGRGVLILQNGQRYQGNFRDDQVHGQGVWKGKDGFVRGAWQQGQLIKILN